MIEKYAVEGMISTKILQKLEIDLYDNNSLKEEDIQYIEMTTSELYDKWTEYINKINTDSIIGNIIAICRLLKYSKNKKNIYFEVIKRKADELALNLAQYSQVLFANNTYPQTKLLKNIFGNNASESHN